MGRDDTATGVRQPGGQTAAPSRFKNFLNRINQQFAYIVGLPIIGVLGTGLVGHFQYLSAYQDKVNTEAKQQISDAEATFVGVSTSFSKAITLQQFLYFNFRDATRDQSDGNDKALETKIARAIYPQYNEVRTNLRESIDLLARKVEITFDWRSDIGRDAATVKSIGTDPMSRIALGAYDFDCDKDSSMPNFHSDKSRIGLPPPREMLKDNANARPLGIDWYSAKHQLLTLYYCFEANHRRITVVRKWAANSPFDTAAKNKFVENLGEIQDSFDRVAVRLNAFMTLAARRIEVIQVKFRPRAWYCHVPVLREIVDAYSKTCKPLRTASASINTSASN